MKCHEMGAIILISLFAIALLLVIAIAHPVHANPQLNLAIRWAFWTVTGMGYFVVAVLAWDCYRSSKKCS